jgi:hypothetical protein
MRRNAFQPQRHQDTKGSLRETLGASWCSLRGLVALWLMAAVMAGTVGCRVYEGADVPAAPIPTAACPPPGPKAEPCWEPPVALNGWRYIVVHHSATPGGSAALFEKYHRENRHWENGMGYHFVIGNGVDVPDGLVEVGSRWKLQQAGAHVGGDLNKECIGICLVGDFSTGHASARQMASLDKLIRFLQGRCRIPTTRVLGHCEVRPGHTVCPGQNFSMPKLRESLSGSSHYQLPVEPAPATAQPPTAAPGPGSGSNAAPGSGAQGMRIYGSVRNLR